MPALLSVTCLAVRPAAPQRAAPEAAKPLPRALAAAAAAVALFAAGPSLAELNRFEGETLGEFNRGTAQQFGGARRRTRTPRPRQRATTRPHVALPRAAPPRAALTTRFRAPGTNQQKVDFCKEYASLMKARLATSPTAAARSWHVCAATPPPP